MVANKVSKNKRFRFLPMTKIKPRKVKRRKFREKEGFKRQREGFRRKDEKRRGKEENGKTRREINN